MWFVIVSGYCIGYTGMTMIFHLLEWLEIL
jgi:hypothetical protein